MKQVLIAMVVLLSVQFIKAQTTDTKDINKTLAFTNDAYDFGKIPYGVPTKYQLSIKNISADTVILDNVQVGCGCTTPEYEKGKKIAPNETVIIGLGFNGGTEGSFTKFVTIFFSDNMAKQVSFKGETFKPASTPAPTNPTLEKMKPFGTK
jgi:Protein of unknown function (DUF1573)